MNINKLIHGPNVNGQSLADRVIAAKHSLSGQGLAKSVCKATTEELIPPKKKHIDELIRCTHEPNVSIPQLAGLLFDRSQCSTWIVVYKALITTHTLMNYGNERFSQFIASNNCTFCLENYSDRHSPQGYDMAPWIRRYARYLNAKGYSYQHMAYDFCKIKKGKEDGILRVMETDKLLKALPVLQVQVEALLEFDVSKTNLTNPVINASFMMLFKDLIRLLACYNDAIINLLAKYFGMTRKQCKEALELYKNFVERMERVARFLGVAESVGIDRGDIPDLAKAPSSLLEALENHLKTLEKTRKDSRTGNGSATSSAIDSLAAAQKSIANTNVDKMNSLSFAESSVMAVNNPFADLLASSDDTPDSVVNDDHAATVHDRTVANNPFLSAIYGTADDGGDSDAAGAPAEAVVYDDPWSNQASRGDAAPVAGFATAEQFAAAFGPSDESQSAPPAVFPSASTECVESASGGRATEARIEGQDTKLNGSGATDSDVHPNETSQADKNVTVDVKSTTGEKDHRPDELQCSTSGSSPPDSNGAKQTDNAENGRPPTPESVVKIEVQLAETPTEDPDSDEMYIVQQNKPADDVQQEPAADDNEATATANGEEDDDDSYLDLR